MTPTPPPSPIAERLGQLAILDRDGLISDGEYAEQRGRVLGELSRQRAAGHKRQAWS
ncbi:hypothetical protein [Micromonospora taraxaci]|uniref:hypothetical protein n=1 Tax=Micromonospora taraxaci TaxID=1316803 RepID=UPI0033B75C8F